MSASADIIGAVVGGGATGILGNLFSQITGYFGAKLKFKNDQARWVHEREMVSVEATIAEKRMNIELEGKRDEVDAQVRIASYNEAQTRYSTGQSAWLYVLDFIRGMVRPMITFGLFGLIIWMWFDANNEAIEEELTLAAIYLWMTVTTWWFGARAGRAPDVSGRIRKHLKNKPTEET